MLKFGYQQTQYRAHIIMASFHIAAKQQAQQCLKNKGDLSQLTAELGKSTLSAKAGQFALQSLATAGNMFVSWAVTQ